MEKKPDSCYNFLMYQTYANRRSASVRMPVLGLAAMLAAAGWITYARGWDTLAGRIIPKPAPEWIFIDQPSVASGAIIPSDTNVVFQLPDGMPDITREVLFGQKGKLVRYWGYCFDENDDPKVVGQRVGSKRLLYLSEKERAVRAQREQATQRPLSPFNPPTVAELRKLQETPSKGVIRHQVEVFQANQFCYVMTEENLAIGIDADGDGLNSKLEQELKTDPDVADTDGDGLPDGIEFKIHSNPLLRDSDSDGLIDGLEDRNANGKVDRGETNPVDSDTDKDDLCDGQCRILLPNKRSMYAGEDKNLNGQLDAGETDPLKKDTDGNGITDYQDFVQCLSKSQTSC